MAKISDLMRIFKDPNLYDYDRFPKFSQKKWNLKNTEKGVMSVSKELQQVIDREKAETEKRTMKDTANLMSFLVSNGRGDDVVKASQDENFLNKLLTEFRDGMLVEK